MIQKIRELLRNEYHLEDRLVIGHVGRFSPEKNHKKIAENCKSSPSKEASEVKLVFVGDGPLKQEIEERPRRQAGCIICGIKRCGRTMASGNGCVGFSVVI